MFDLQNAAMEFLLIRELQELTGLQRPSSVRRWLEQKEVPFMMGADGWPRVLKAIILQRMGVVRANASSNEPRLRLRNG